jgi:diguanylate cyclase (GGDEF)-like protein/PAS domain S-box-containing protein
MVSLTSPRTERVAQTGRVRLVLLALSALIAPASLIVESARGRLRDVAVIAILSACVFMLVLLRLSEMLADNRRALERERALRQAGDAMVSATDPAAVRAAVEVAVSRMVPPGTRIAAELVDGIAVSGDPPVALKAELRYTDALVSWLPSSLRRFDLVLVCPLPTREPAGTGAASAALVLGADELVLSTMQPPLEVLAGQATLALERIALTEEVNRRKSDEYFRTLVQNAADVILIVDDLDTVTYASPSARSVFGAQPVVGRELGRLLVAAGRGQTRALMSLARSMALTADRPEPQGVDWLIRRSDGEVVHVEASIQDLTDDATVRGRVVTLRDVTDRRRLEDELTRHAFHDPLTGVANRLLFQERVRVAVARAAERNGTVGVLFIDLDDFKIVNDTMGHHAGDQLLVAVVKRLTEVLRPQDSAARLGGDEFAALIEDVADPIDVERIAARSIEALSEPFMVGETMVSGTSSIGVATTTEAVDAQDLLRQADLALYVAKGGGKGQWRRYQSELHTAVLRRMELRQELDQAVKDSSFELHYQPIVRISDGRPAGFEALVRWQHPKSGLVAPAFFIDVAEESGLIIPLGDWVMGTAMACAATWDDDTYVSVNVSVRQFRTAGIVERVAHHLAETGLRPSRLMLEITESLLLPDEEQVWDDLNALRAMGVRVAIDDFGTGYSSLSYLRRVPIDAVKIDRSFVASVASSEQQRELVRGIVWLTSTLGLQVIAEGIETTVERDVLAELGCPMGQGYLYSPPMPPDAIAAWLDAERLAA